MDIMYFQTWFYFSLIAGTVPATSGILQHAVRMKKTYVNPDHGNLLQTELSQLWKDGKYFDADLEVSGTKIPVSFHLHTTVYYNE